MLGAAGCAGPLTIVAGGDLHLGPRSALPLAPLADVLRGDLRLCNLEGPLVDGCAPRGEVLCGPVDRAGALRERIDVAVLENNHVDDQGPAGRASTERALASSGVLAAGARTELVRRGQRLTILARALPPGALPAAELLDEIRAAAHRGRTVVVSLHWGQTGVHLPSPEERAAARALVDAGAVAVLGHGPHTVQPVERYRHGVIAYSLGNLAFECDCSTESDSFVLRFVVDARRRVGTIALHPIEAGVRGGASRPSTDAQLRRLLMEIEKGFGVATEERGGLLFVSPTRGD